MVWVIRTRSSRSGAADRKAKKLTSLLERQKAVKKFKGKLPFLEPLIFCSAPDQQNQLTGTAAYRVCLRRDSRSVRRLP